jgi:hypothetical protein
LLEGIEQLEDLGKLRIRQATHSGGAAATLRLI